MGRSPRTSRLCPRTRIIGISRSRGRRSTSSAPPTARVLSRRCPTARPPHYLARPRQGRRRRASDL
eukprot:1210917-Pyramimonas_sp.AAC.1